MTQNQINRYERDAALIDFFNSQAAKWSSINKVGEFKNALEAIHVQIGNAHEAQNNAQIRVGKNKKELKHLIAQKVDILNDVAEAMAVVNGNVELESKMAMSATELYASKNEDFSVKIKETISLVEANKDVLIAEYGLSEEQLSDVKADINSFNDLLGAPRAYQVASRQATSDLESLFAEANQVLEQKLDKVMKIFKRRDSNFYNGYLAAREIVDN